MISDIVTWGTAIASFGALITAAKFWIDIGKAHAKADAAASTAMLLNAKFDLASAHLSEFKVTVAQTYATQRALNETEVSLMAGLERSMQGVFQRLDQMTQRLDSLIVIANREHH